ncbi:MAG: MmgE/PrpD family protein [Burkholderiales bacterium]|nr:MmgE/PrpD family protein [Burkholderiales bacterium]
MKPITWPQRDRQQPQEWDPQTRGTITATTYPHSPRLQDGSISVATFDEDRIRDPRTATALNRIEVSENRGSRHSRAMMNKSKFSQGGQRFVEEGQYPKGRTENPISRCRGACQVRSLCQGLLPEDRTEALLDTVEARAPARAGQGIGSRVYRINEVSRNERRTNDGQARQARANGIGHGGSAGIYRSNAYHYFPG